MLAWLNFTLLVDILHTYLRLPIGKAQSSLFRWTPRAYWQVNCLGVCDGFQGSRLLKDQELFYRRGKECRWSLPRKYQGDYHQNGEFNPLNSFQIYILSHIQKEGCLSQAPRLIRTVPNKWIHYSFVITIRISTVKMKNAFSWRKTLKNYPVRTFKEICLQGYETPLDHANQGQDKDDVPIDEGTYVVPLITSRFSLLFGPH